MTAMCFAAPARADFVNGDILMEWAKEYRRVQAGAGDSLSLVLVRRFQVYVTGIYDAHQTLLYPLANDKIFCAPKNATVNQLSKAVLRFLDGHPERKHEAGSILVAAALADTFPCERSTE
jgi:hypothetical protein